MILHSDDHCSPKEASGEGKNPDACSPFFPGDRVWGDPRSRDQMPELGLSSGAPDAKEQGQGQQSRPGLYEGGTSWFSEMGAVGFSCDPGGFPSWFPPVC